MSSQSNKNNNIYLFTYSKMIEKNNLNKTNNCKTVFIPPRKRQSIKKLNGLPQNYVDHVIPHVS